MKTLLFFLFVAPIFSLKITQPKLCVNCKYFITDNDTGKFGKCSLFTKDTSTFLVNGIIDNDSYYYCSVARSCKEMCDKEGKMYKKKRNTPSNENMKLSNPPK